MVLIHIAAQSQNLSSILSNVNRPEFSPPPPPPPRKAAFGRLLPFARGSYGSIAVSNDRSLSVRNGSLCNSCIGLDGCDGTQVGIIANPDLTPYRACLPAISVILFIRIPKRKDLVWDAIFLAVELVRARIIGLSHQ